jgi:UDP-N-acetylmuramyl pentapeptide phosphotransferase/UDP-N-acetylglucosamine-1-phosphate transferase
MNDLSNFEDGLESYAFLTDESFRFVFLSALCNPTDGLDVLWLKANFVAFDVEGARSVAKFNSGQNAVLIAVIICVLYGFQQNVGRLCVELLS